MKLLFKILKFPPTFFHDIKTFILTKTYSLQWKMSRNCLENKILFHSMSYFAEESPNQTGLQCNNVQKLSNDAFGYPSLMCSGFQCDDVFSPKDVERRKIVLLQGSHRDGKFLLRGFSHLSSGKFASLSTMFPRQGAESEFSSWKETRTASSNYDVK